jgi:DNA topoisomerase IB
MIFSGNGASQILDPAGRPYQRERYDEFAIPHVMTGQWIYKSGWQTYWHRWDEAVKKNREDALAMRRDAWLMALLQERRLAVASLKWHIEVDNEKDPHEKALKDGLTKILKTTPRLQSLFYYLDDAIWYGRYGSQLHYGWRNMDLPAPAPGPSIPGQPAVKTAQNQKRRALCIQRGLGHPGHIPVNGDKIGHKLDHTPYVLVHGSEDDQLSKPPTPIWTTEAKAMPLEGWLRDRFILHCHEFTDADFLEAEMAEGVHGVGIRTFVYFLDWLKKEWLSNISDFMERAGLGVRLWYYQGGNDDARAKIEQVAKDNIRRVNILIPRYPGDRGQAQDTMEWRDVPTAGAEFLLEMIKWIEEGIERFIIGQTLSSNTEGSGLGGTGVASMHAETKHRIIAFDANNLADTLTQDWVRVVQYWTYPEYREIPARFVFDVDNPDAEKVLNAVKTFIDIGGEVPEDAVRGLIGVPAPAEGDKVLSAQKIQEAMGQGQGQNQIPQPGQEPKEEEEEPWAAGGVTIQGKKYEGGEFIPGDVMERATEEEKRTIRGEGEEFQKPKEKKINQGERKKLAVEKTGDQEPSEQSEKKAASISSNAYSPEAYAYAPEWIKIAARNNKISPKLQLTAYSYSSTHVAIGPSIQEIHGFLTEALNRDVEPFRDGWLISPKEAEWLGFKKDDKGVTIPALIRRTGSAERLPGEAKVSELTGHSPLKKIQSLYEGFKDFSYQDITAAVKEIAGSLPAKDAKELAKDFDIARPMPSKAKVIEGITRKIKDRKESWERTQFRKEGPHEEPEQLSRGPGLLYEFEESKHPRGQPENPGQFAPKDSSSQKGVEEKQREGFHPIQRLESGNLPAEVRERLKMMRLPPAWSGVQVANDPNSELQAFGFDAKGRKQYVYSAAHWQKTNQEKFLRIKALVAELDHLEAKIRQDVGKKEEAGVLLLMRKTGFRIGSEEDRQTEHKALGATTLTSDNVKIEGAKVTFDFIGKKGVHIRQEIEDAELARLLKPRIKPGEKLFATSEKKVRDYLHFIDGVFKPKDFRTAVAAETALNAIQQMERPETPGEFKRAKAAVGKAVAEKLGNTPAVALASYIPPEVFLGWERVLKIEADRPKKTAKKKKAS